MDYEVWERYYQQILEDFGFERKEDERSAAVLNDLLNGKDLVSEDELRAQIQGEDIVVVGGGGNIEEELRGEIPQDVIIAADGTTSTILKKGLLPHIIVTDLDGDIEDQISANNRGSIVAIHAHGDNIEQVRKWTPQFNGKVLGTVQCKPFDNLHNFGGFTDGDRGVFLAEHFRAASIRLVGFDFESVGDKPHSDKAVKLKKLGWAKRLIKVLGITLE